MPKNKRLQLFVTFNDSESNPTYISAHEASLVLAEDDGKTNPCVSKTAQFSALVPRDLFDLDAFASLVGWSVGYDDDGHAILHTGIVDPERIPED